MNNLYTDFGYVSLNHVGETLCGDNVTVSELKDDSFVAVLADGLGSGVKANILSTLTSTMMSKMIDGNIDIAECVKTIIATLPVCKDRGVAYSTFSICMVSNNRDIRIYNYDNPSPFIIRKGKAFLPNYTVTDIHGKRIEEYRFEAEVNDCIFMMSDGVIHAGIGDILNYGWEEKEIMEHMAGICREESAAKVLATTLIDRCNFLYKNEPSDDVTCAVVKVRERKHVNLMIGPSTKPEDDEKLVSLFMAKKGKHVVSGGTTASIVARCLHQDIIPVYDDNPTDVPPMSKIEGIDLVTEGMVTLNKVLEYGKNYAGKNDRYFEWNYKTDGAARLATILFEEASDVDIYMGCHVNPAHQHNSKLGVNLKMKLIEELSQTLEKMKKTVKVTYY